VGSQAWFIVGAAIFMAAGGGHAALALVDLLRPTFFTPIDDPIRSAMQTTTFRFRSFWPGAADGTDVTPTIWRLWLGFNVIHGIGAFVFGLVCVLIAAHDFALVESIGALRPLTIAVSASYFALALRFWFYVPAVATGSALACFTVSALAA
jgi:hypothetical protein